MREEHYGDFIAQESLGLLHEFSRVFPHAKKWSDAVHEAQHASGDDTALPNFFDSLEVLSTPAVHEILLIAGDIVGNGCYFRNEKMIILASVDGYLRCNSR